ncbi:MAG: DUF4339 domain-containing protein [Methyloceanibacter sp.]
MQHRIAPSDAQTRAPGWYLAKGDQEFGPLTDRELAMLAERGGLKPEDLLWTPGFDTWRPAHSVADRQAAAKPTKPPSLSDAAHDVPAAAAAVSAPQAQSRARNLRTIAVVELKSFIAIFVYLWFVFTVFLIHEWVVLANNSISFRFYGLAAINALVLAKIMLVAEKLRFAERFDKGPLAYPILYKSLLFSILLLAAYIVEEVVVGMIHGGGVVDSVPRIGGGSVAGMLAVGAIMGIALVPFFAFRELGRAIGPVQFRSLIFGPNAPRWWPLAPRASQLRRRDGASEAA